MESRALSPSEYSSAALAYLGDAVFEVLVRRHLCETGIGDAGRLNAMALDYVKATRQSMALEALLPLFTEEEDRVFRRARNKSGAHSKSAAVAEYRRATGLEAVFGYLELTGNRSRMQELFRAYCTAIGGEQQSHEEK